MERLITRQKEMPYIIRVTVINPMDLLACVLQQLHTEIAVVIQIALTLLLLIRQYLMLATIFLLAKPKRTYCSMVLLKITLPFPGLPVEMVPLQMKIHSLRFTIRELQIFLTDKWLLHLLQPLIFVMMLVIM